MKETIASLQQSYPDFTITFDTYQGKRSYHIFHKPSGLTKVCVGVHTLTSVKRLLDNFETLRKDPSYFRITYVTFFLKNPQHYQVSDLLTLAGIKNTVDQDRQAVTVEKKDEPRTREILERNSFYTTAIIG